MPQTKFQEFIYTLMMVPVMVYFMLVYNFSFTPDGLTNETFLHALIDTPMETAICFGVEFLFVGRIVPKIVFRALDPQKTQPFFIMVVMSAVTVMFTCPCMSFISSLIYTFNGPEFIIVNWFTSLVKNFPMALFLQLFFAGPVVRIIFRRIFKLR